MPSRRRDRDNAWRPFAELLERESARPDLLRVRIEQLDLPAADRALLRELLGLD